MNNNDFYMQCLYGTESANNNITEQQDPFTDESIKSIESISNDILYINTYEAIDNIVSNEKIKMISKISNNYGKFNKSIESYCQSKENAENKQPFIDKLKVFFIKLWDAIKSLIAKVVNVFKRILGIKPNNEEFVIKLNKVVDYQQSMIKRMDNSISKVKFMEKSPFSENDAEVTELTAFSKIFQLLTKLENHFVQSVSLYDREAIKLINFISKNQSDESVKKYIASQPLHLNFKVFNSKIIDSFSNDLCLLVKIFIDNLMKPINEETSTAYINTIIKFNKINNNAIDMLSNIYNDKNLSNANPIIDKDYNKTTSSSIDEFWKEFIKVISLEIQVIPIPTIETVAKLFGTTTIANPRDMSVLVDNYKLRK